MSTERIADLRSGIQSLDVARAVFDNLALHTLKLAAQDAAFEKRVANLKSFHSAATAGDRDYISNTGLALAQFITQHQNLFKNPRKIKTSLGSFGLQSVSELLISDPVRLEERVMDLGYDDCFERVIKFLKPAIKKRLETGEKLPGARIVSGDTAVYKVDKSLVDEARQNAV